MMHLVDRKLGQLAEKRAMGCILLGLATVPLSKKALSLMPVISNYEAVAFSRKLEQLERLRFTPAGGMPVAH
jgi:hypothetical protein